MNKKEWEVKTTVVKRLTVYHRVFADSKAEAIDLVVSGRGERSGRDERIVERPNYSGKRVKSRT